MTSANISGQPQLSFKEAKKTFKQIKETYYFGEGNNKTSTIIRVNDGKILR
jgi:tRNA A37 threonylcarbamoyladenosine synthetase subunit TsaC/SUA5/YrdC